MTVVIAIPVLLTGGTEIQTFHLSKILCDAGYKVIVLCYFEYDYQVVKHFNSINIRVILLRATRQKIPFCLFRQLVYTFHSLSPDIVHVQYLAPGLIPIIASRLSGVKKVLATVHQPGRIYGNKAKFLLRISSFLCNLFLCVSKSVEVSWFGDSALFDSSLYKQGRTHFTIYNGIDYELIINEKNSNKTFQFEKEYGLAGKKVIGYFGRMRWEKGPHILLDAFAQIVKQVPNVKLLMVGDGPELKKLRAQSVMLNISADTLFIGNKTQKEVFQLYGLIDVVAIPSFFEGFGLTAAEAAAAGIPVVGFDVDGLREVITDRINGVLVKPGHIDQFIHSILMFLQESYSIPNNLSDDSDSLTKFSMATYIRNILKAYNSV